jgi:SAM-dependent methyltransferase
VIPINLEQFEALVATARDSMKDVSYFRPVLKAVTSKQASVLEIGAGASGLFRKKEYPESRILDFYSDEEIVAHYANDYGMSGLAAKEFESVDFVCKDGDYRTSVGREACFDLVFSSHVIEHQPCLVRHLQQIESLLAPGGAAVFIVPDKNCTFDALRQPSRTADVLAAFHGKAQKPVSANLFDFYSRHIDLNPGRKISAADSFKFSFSLADAYEKFKASCDGEVQYLDIHNWVFTPRTLVVTLIELHMLGLTQLFPRIVTETVANEFMCVLALQAAQPTADELEFLNGLRLETLKGTLGS